MREREKKDQMNHLQKGRGDHGLRRLGAKLRALCRV
jgi:hypothetical protein